MSIEPIGLATFLAGLICLYLGYRATVTTLIVTTVFGSAAAILIGAANIQPAHFLLAFMAIATLSRRRELAGTIAAVQYPKPAFWLMCMVAYGVVTGFVMPRLLAGTTPIMPLGTSADYADTGTTVPLGPVSGNFTQSIYLIADFILFVMIVAIASTRVGFTTVTNALVAYAAANGLFALLDIVTFATGTQPLLEFMRNAQYTLHVDEQVSGLKRIVGSFTEASAFAHSTLGALGFTGTLWLCGYRPALTGFLALSSLILVVFSTSSTGLAGTPPVLLILYATALMRSGFHPKKPFTSAALLCAPLLVIAVIIAAQLDSETSEPIRRYLDELVFNKSTSGSAIERGSWNTLGLQNFVDSFGLGVGLGTVRVSSFVVALLSNVGIPGTISYLLFAYTAFARSRGVPRSFWSDARLAGRNACLALMTADTFAGTTVDQGLLFYILAGLACAEPELYDAPRAPAPLRQSAART